MSRDIRLSKTAMKIHDDWCRRNGYPVQASSSKLQAASIKRYNNTDYKIFGKPSTRKYRRMGVALAYGDEKTEELVLKAKEVASKIQID